MKKTPKSMAYYQCEYEIVWYTKYKRKVITGEFKKALEHAIPLFALQSAAQIKQMSLTSNMVRMIVKISPDVSVNQVVSSIRRKTGAMRASYPEVRSRIPCLWTKDYMIWTRNGEPGHEEQQEFSRSIPTTQRKKEEKCKTHTKQ